MNKDDKIKLLLEFCNEKKRVPKRVEEYKGINIGEFYSAIRRGGINISNEQKELLIKNEIYLVKDIRVIRTHDKVQKLIQFKKKYNRLPHFGEEIDGVRLKEFLDCIITKRIKISSPDKNLLMENGIDLNYCTKEEKMEKKLKLIIEFYNLYGKSPSHLTIYKDINIGRFFKSIIYDEIKNAEKYKEVLKKEGVIK